MKAAQLCLAVVVSLLLMTMGSTAAKCQGAAVIVVDTTSDVVDCHDDCTDCPCYEGYCSVGDLPGPDGLIALREAVCVANGAEGPQVIEFDIPTSDPGYDGQTFTIRPHWVLQLVDDGTTIDGTTQPTLSNPYGPEIVLDGSELTTDPGEGIGIAGSNSVVRGLAIHSFGGGAGIQFFGPTPDNNVVSQCYVGTDATGSIALPNWNWHGVRIGGRGNVLRDNLIVGASAASGGENLIEGNLIGTDVNGTQILDAQGFSLFTVAGTIVRGNLVPGGIDADNWGDPGGATGPNVIEGNWIGTDRSGQISLGFRQVGITIRDGGAYGNIVRRNTVAFFSDAGIWVRNGTGNTISENSIFASEEGQGIDLGSTDCCPDGVTENDEGDGDTGPNNLMNFPVFTSALAAPGKLVVRGTIDTLNPSAVLVEFFATDPDADPSGHGPGKTFLGRTTPNPVGKFTATLDSVEPGTLITATATDEFGNTSEFAANVVATAPGG